MAEGLLEWDINHPRELCPGPATTIAVMSPHETYRARGGDNACVDCSRQRARVAGLLRGDRAAGARRRHPVLDSPSFESSTKPPSTRSSRHGRRPTTDGRSRSSLQDAGVALFPSMSNRDLVEEPTPATPAASSWSSIILRWGDGSTPASRGRCRPLPAGCGPRPRCPAPTRTMCSAASSDCRARRSSGCERRRSSNSAASTTGLSRARRASPSSSPWQVRLGDELQAHLICLERRVRVRVAHGHVGRRGTGGGCGRRRRTRGHGSLSAACGNELGDARFDGCTTAGAAMEAAEAVRYARQQIELARFERADRRSSRGGVLRSAPTG